MNLKAKVGLDTGGFDAGIKRMKTKADAFIAKTNKQMKRPDGLSRVGPFAALASIPIVGSMLAAGAKKTLPAEEASRIRDESKKIGVSTTTFQELDYAARQSGGSIQDVGKAFKALSIRQQDAIRGNKEYTESFARYGVTVDELKAKKPQELFALISKQVEGGVNKANELADVQRLLGKSGTELLPTMQAGLGAAMTEAARIGAPLSPELVKKYSDMGDQMTKIGQYGSKTFYQASENIPGTGKAVMAVELASKLIDYFTQQNPKEQEALLRGIKENTAPLNRP